MSTFLSAEACLARAAEDARNAQETDLPNVRERYLQSEAVWRAMAERDLNTAKGRKEREAEKPALDGMASE